MTGVLTCAAADFPDGSGFASNQGKNREGHISRESISAAIRRMGYQGQI
ncbi:MAG: hypothetical protein QX190_03365 [Methylococcales bacterium]